MDKSISVDEAAATFRSVVEDVTRNGTEYVVGPDGHPAVALIPYERLVELRRKALGEDEFRERWARFRRNVAALTREVDEDELAADVEAAIQEVRAERREQSA